MHYHPDAINESSQTQRARSQSTRSTSEVLQDWPAEWSTDKTIFRKVVISVENLFPDLQTSYPPRQKVKKEPQSTQNTSEEAEQGVVLPTIETNPIERIDTVERSTVDSTPDLITLADDRPITVDQRTPTPELRTPSPERRRRLFEHRTPTPELRTPSPEKRRRLFEHRTPTPEPRAPTPERRRQTFEQRIPGAFFETTQTVKPTVKAATKALPPSKPSDNLFTASNTLPPPKPIEISSTVPTKPTTDPFTAMSGQHDQQGLGPGFSGQQAMDLAQIINTIMDRREAERRHSRNGPGGPTDPEGSGSNDNSGDRSSKEWTAEAIGFFDPGAEGNEPVSNVGKHVFYKDVYAFVDRLKDVALLKGDDKLRNILPQCLRGTALIWHSTELSDMEKNMLREASMKFWHDALIERFKERTPAALSAIQNAKYTLEDARRNKDPRTFAQDIFRHAKAANLVSVHNQLSMAWNAFDWRFRQNIPEPKEHTTISQFLGHLDSQSDIWFEMAQSERRLGPPKRSGKQNQGNDRSTQDQYDPRDRYRNNRSSNRSRFSPAPQNNTYYGQQRRSDREVPPVQVTIDTPGAKERSIKREDRSKSYDKGYKDKAYKDKTYDKGKKYDKNYKKDKDRGKGKAKAYLAEEESSEHTDDDYDEDAEYYNVHDDDTDEEDADDDPDEVSANLVTIPEASCRNCKEAFSSNNELHRHLRSRKCTPPRKNKAKTNVAVLTSTSNDALQSSSIPIQSSSIPSASSSDVIARKRRVRTKASSKSSNLVTTSTDDIQVVRSNIDANKDIGTGYGFKGWQYATAQVSLSSNGKLEPCCLDSGAGISLADINFFKAQSDAPIREMASPITVRGLGVSRHATDKYAVVPIYLSGTKDGKPAKALIEREVHLVENLKANMIIGNDILGPEAIDILASSATAHIGSCGVTIPIAIKSRSSFQTRPVHATKTVVLPPHSEIQVPVHSIESLPDRDYLFEPAEVNFSIYAHLLNPSTKAIIARNDSDKPIKISRNFRLGKVVEMDGIGAHIAETEESELALRVPKSTHKSSWLKRALVACATAAAAVAPMSAPVSPTYSATSSPAIAAYSAITTPTHVLPMAETILPNGVTVHQSSAEAVKTFTDIVNDYPKLWTDQGFADLPEDNWMKIPLKEGWEEKIKGKARVYPLGTKDRAIVDDTFDELHRQGKLEWTDKSTPFSFPCFVVYRGPPDKRKGRVVIDIRALNEVTLPDAYPIPLQADIIQAVHGAAFLSVIDCASFFYQWRVHLRHRHRLTVVTHRGQESFNVAVMGYKNSPAYVQRQIDRILRLYRAFARAYVDDIIVFSKTAEEHAEHLRKIFDVLSANNISINPKKAFIGYPSVNLLGQRVNSLGLSTDEEKLKAIATLSFPTNLSKLETYLGLTGWFRDYIEGYAGKAKPLQDRKTALLKPSPKAGHARKSYSARTKIIDPTEAEKQSFASIQQSLSSPSFLIHFNAFTQLYVDLDASKEFGFGAMVYHVKDYAVYPRGGTIPYPPKKRIQPIMFLSRLLRPAETRYWPTELELAGIVWVLRKIRHLVESSKHPTVIFTDHGAALGIAKQTSLTTSSTDRLNLRLVRASDYIQRFDPIILHKPGKQHIVPDALSRLPSGLQSKDSTTDGELDVLSVSEVQLSEDLLTRIKEGYTKDPTYDKIIKVLNKATEDGSILPFVWGDNGIIFRVSLSDDASLIPSRIAVPDHDNLIKEILTTAHDAYGHQGFEKSYDRVRSSWYIRNLTKRLKDYIKHCPTCGTNQTRRHKPFGALQPIMSPSVPFHTITMDFVLALPLTKEGFDCILTITDKYSKRISLIPGKQTWGAKEWAEALLMRLDIADWGLPKKIISDRDRKFLSEFWTTLFIQLGVKLAYSTGYHPQTDGASERTNQTIEIALRFLFHTLRKATEWPSVLGVIQRSFNNSPTTVGRTPNEICYGFTPVTSSTLAKPSPNPISTTTRTNIRNEVEDTIALGQMLAKNAYDKNHKLIELKIDDWVLLRLHKGYSIPSSAILGRKLSQQYAGPFQITERIGTLAYRLAIPLSWKVHPIFSVAHLEPASPSATDPYQRTAPPPPAIHVDGDTDLAKSYEIERIVTKRATKRRGTEYLVRWRGYGPEEDSWRNEAELGDASEVLKEFLESNTSASTSPTSTSPTSTPPTSTPLTHTHPIVQIPVRF